MLREPKDKTLGDTTYRVTPLGAVTGRKVLLRLAKVLSQVSSGDMSKVVDSLTESDFEYICDTFAKFTAFTSDSGRTWPQLSDMFDLHFAGKYDRLLEWLAFAVEVNFASFFARLGEVMGGSLPKTPDAPGPSPGT